MPPRWSQRRTVSRLTSTWWILEHQEDDRLAAPAAAEEAEVARGVFADPVDDDLDPGGVEAKGAAALVPAQGLDPLVAGYRLTQRSMVRELQKRMVATVAQV